MALDLGVLRVKLAADVAGLRQGFQSATRQIEALRSRLGEAAQAARQLTVPAAAAATGLVYSARQMAQAAFQNQAATRIFEQQLLRTGHSIADVQAEAEALAAELRVTPDVIRANAGELLRAGYRWEQIRDIYRGAAASALIVGKSTEQGIETATSALVTQMSVYLNEIGIVQNLNTAYQQYARARSKSVDQLTDAERAEAAHLMILRATEQEVRDLPILFEGYGGAAAEAGLELSRLHKTLGERLLPYVTRVVEVVTNGVRWFNNLDSATQGLILRIGGFGAAVVMGVAALGLLTHAMGMLATVGTFLGGVLGAVLSAPFLLLIAKVGAFIALVGLLRQAWESNWLGIRDAAEAAWAKIKPIIDALGEWAGRTLETVWNWAVGAIGTFWEWLRDTAWPWLSATASTTWQWVAERAGAVWGWLIDTAFPWIGRTAQTTWQWLAEKAGQLWGWLTETAFPWLGRTASTTWRWIAEQSGALWDWLRTTAFPWIGQTASTVWRWTAEKAGQFWDWLTEIGWPWLSATASTAWRWTLDWVGAAWEWLRDTAFPWLGQAASTLWWWTVGAVGRLADWLIDTAWPWIANTVETVWNWVVRIPDWARRFVEWVTTAPRQLLDRIFGGGPVEGAPGFQHGTILPGSGGPDRYPAWLAPGEAVVPAWAVRGGWATTLAWFQAMGVPGFQMGGGFALPRGAASLSIGGLRLGDLQSWIDSIGNAVRQVGQTLLRGVQAIVEFIARIVDTVGRALLGERWEAFTGRLDEARRMVVDFIDALFRSRDTGTQASQAQAEAADAVERAARLTDMLAAGFQRAHRWVGHLGSALGDGVRQSGRAVGGAFRAMLRNPLEAVTRGLIWLDEAAGKAASALGQMAGTLLRGIGQAAMQEAPILRSAVEGASAMAAGGPAAMAAGALVAILAESQTFAGIMATVNPVLEQFANLMGHLLGAVGPLVQAVLGVATTLIGALRPTIETIVGALGALFVAIAPIIEIVGAVLAPVFQVLGVILEALIVPVMKALFPVVKVLGLAIGGVAWAIGQIWNGLLSVLQSVFRALGSISVFGWKPLGFLNDWAASLERAKMDTDGIARSLTELAGLTWEQAQATAQEIAASYEMQDAAEEASEALRNVPSGFKYVLSRFGVADAVPMQHGGIVEAGPEAVVPLAAAGAGLGGTTIVVQLSGPVYGLDDFDRRVQEAVSRAARRAGLANRGLARRV